MTAQLTHETVPVTTTELAAYSGHGPLRRAWHRIRLATREMNHASQRIVEVQAPWSLDAQWHRK